MMTEERAASKLFWVDMEMTGLDERKDKILEVAVVVTDLDLNPVEEYHSVVFQPQEILATMDPWCVTTHGESGLSDEVRQGTPLSEVEGRLVALAKKHFPGEKVVLCGNSVGQDKKFIEAYMPKLNALLHYRVIDVSSFKEIFRAKYGITVEKKDRHRAKDDIHESIAELKHYLQFVRVGG
jgi:oligoribonuclease